MDLPGICEVLMNEAVDGFLDNRGVGDVLVVGTPFIGFIVGCGPAASTTVGWGFLVWRRRCLHHVESEVNQMVVKTWADWCRGKTQHETPTRQ
jgi:hypothetical protein